MLPFLPKFRRNPTREIGPTRIRALWTFGAIAWFCFPTLSFAQDDLFHSCTLNVGGGLTPVSGKDGSTLNRGWNFQAGGGFAVTSKPAPGHNWSALVTVNFLYDESGIKPDALQQARTLNPQNIGLLQATSGRAKLYSTTLDPTFRFRVKSQADIYVFGGYGWFRRTLEFTGVSSQGELLQPGNPVVFGRGGNSGGFDAGGGVNFKLPHRLSGLMVYAEAKVLKGLAINSGTTLLPVSFGVRW
jgi:hypothetical protein